MIKPAIQTTILSVLMLGLGSTGAIAQSPQPTTQTLSQPTPQSASAPNSPVPGTLTPAKQALIKELLELTNAKQNATAVMDQILASLEASLPSLVSNTLAKSGVQGEELKQRTNEFAARVLKRYKERLPQVVNLSETTEQISYVVYDKFFTENDLKGMIAFYKSPTGKKVISISPKLFAESMQLSNQLVLPKVVQLMQDIVREETDRLPSR